MTRSRIEQAVSNNAIWCDTLCRAHGAPGVFYDAIWLNRSPVPRFYPNAITLSDRRDVHVQRTHLETLLALNLPASWGIKDSFCALDLTRLGFQLQFEATWLWRTPTRMTLDVKNDAAQWTVVQNESKLAQWEAAWSGDPVNASPRPQLRLFVPALLDEQDIAFIAAYQGERIVAGAIVNRAADVAGLTNFLRLRQIAPRSWLVA